MVTDLWRFYPVACVQPSPNLSKSHYSTIRSAQLGRGFFGEVIFCSSGHQEERVADCTWSER